MPPRSAHASAICYVLRCIFVILKYSDQPKQALDSISMARRKTSLAKKSHAFLQNYRYEKR